MKATPPSHTHVLVSQVAHTTRQPGLVSHHGSHVLWADTEHGRCVAVPTAPRDAVLGSTAVVVPCGMCVRVWGRSGVEVLQACGVGVLQVCESVGWGCGARIMLQVYGSVEGWCRSVERWCSI